MARYGHFAANPSKLQASIELSFAHGLRRDIQAPWRTGATFLHCPGAGREYHDPMTRPGLPLTHVLLALAVVAVWGTNFVVIRIGLDHLPPLTFAVLRFTFALLPAVFFLKKPAVPWRNLAAYGVLIGAGQFGLLYIAINGFISPGLASLVVQTQVFFTIGLAMWLAKERLRSFQIVALALAAVGLLVIVSHNTDASVTPIGLALPRSSCSRSPSSRSC